MGEKQNAAALLRRAQHLGSLNRNAFSRDVAGYLEAHNLYAYILASCGQPDEAVKEAQKSHALDPVARASDLAKVYYAVRRFELAAAEAERELALEQDSPALHWLLFRYLRRTGQIPGERPAPA
jgi:tetratricopeptide (TPR) repeat protein